MLSVYYSNRFKKDYKMMMKRNVKIEDFEFVVRKLRNEEPLPENVVTMVWKATTKILENVI